jgi:hypothetical protein
VIHVLLLAVGIASRCGQRGQVEVRGGSGDELELVIALGAGQRRGLGGGVVDVDGGVRSVSGVGRGPAKNGVSGARPTVLNEPLRASGSSFGQDVIKD